MKSQTKETGSARRQALLDVQPHLGRRSVSQHWPDLPTRWTLELLHPAYVAGIIDGEGSVFSRGQGTPHVGFGNTDREVIRRFGVFGGSIVEDVRRRYALGGKPFWSWGAWGERAALILRVIHPFMAIKGDPARVALEEWDRVTFSGVMTHPRKRAFHIVQCREQMSKIGWPVSGPSVYDIPCKNGHRMSPENLYYYGDGRASCRVCREDYHRVARERKRAK